MKTIIFSCALLAVTAMSCLDQKPTEKQLPSTESEPMDQAKNIAMANGYDQWDNVNQIKFTFNVDRPDRHFQRSWTWEPKTGRVVLESQKDTVVFNHKKVDSASYAADVQFINDKYWLLGPFNLLWDNTATLTSSEKEFAPFTKDTLRKLTITYPAEGGYTPGDAYDYYYDDQYNIKEWVFRTKNQEEASMIMSWEGQQDFNGVKIYTSHKTEDGQLTIHFTNVSVK